MESLLKLIFILLMTILAFYDLKSRMIPLWIVILIGITGMVRQILTADPDWPGILESMIPGICLLGLHLLIREQIGAGDGMMTLGTGIYLGWRGTVLSLTMGMLIMSLIGSAGLISGRLNRKSVLPFAPCYLTAVLCFLMTGQGGA